MNSLLMHLAQECGTHLRNKHWKLATAESCTGGGLGYYITAIPGSSDWYERGFVVYSNEAKMQMLQVPAEIIRQFGAVSRETALSLASQCLDIAKADVAVSITGVAGPTGGSPEKPVGTVWIGLAGRSFATQAHLQSFQGDRAAIREQCIEAALKLLIKT